MEINLGNGLVWQDDLPIDQQTQDVQAFITDLVSAGSYARDREDCLAGIKRPIVRYYHVNDELDMQMHIIYNSGPTDPDFMGIKEFQYTFLQENNG